MTPDVVFDFPASLPYAKGRETIAGMRVYPSAANG